MEKILGKVWVSNGNLINQYICIWDTGSMETIISDNVVSDLNPSKQDGLFILDKGKFSFTIDELK